MCEYAYYNVGTKISGYGYPERTWGSYLPGDEPGTRCRLDGNCDGDCPLTGRYYCPECGESKLSYNNEYDIFTCPVCMEMFSMIQIKALLHKWTCPECGDGDLEMDLKSGRLACNNCEARDIHIERLPLMYRAHIRRSQDQEERLRKAIDDQVDLLDKIDRLQSELNQRSAMV